MPMTPVWNEGFAGLEAAHLLRSDVWRNPGVEGGGRAVLLVPGFMAGDRTLGLMTAWLRRAGYETRSAGHSAARPSRKAAQHAPSKQRRLKTRIGGQPFVVQEP